MDNSAENLKVPFTTGEWSPYTSERLPEYGPVGELVGAACRAAGIDREYRFYPWPRAEYMVRSGEAFAAFPYVITEERKEHFDFSDVLYHSSAIIIYFDKTPENSYPIPFHELTDLRDYRIGGVRGAYYEEVLRNAGIRYSDTSTFEQSIHMLVAGRIDFCIATNVIIDDAIERLYPDQKDHFKVLASLEGDESVALLVSRSYPGARGIVQRFNRGLKIIKDNGEYDRILNRYGLKP